MQKFSKMAKSHHFHHTYDDLRAGIAISWRCFRRSDSFFRRFSRFQISTLGWCGRNSLQVLGGSEAVSWWMQPNKPILDAIWNLQCHCAALSISTHGHWFLQLVFLVFRGLVLAEARYHGRQAIFHVQIAVLPLKLLWNSMTSPCQDG